MAIALADDPALEAPAPTQAPSRRIPARMWAALWPKLLAFGIFTLAWQIVVWTGWKPEYVLPSPFTVYNDLLHNLGSNASAAWVTIQRGAIGFALAVIIGAVIGIAVARSKVLRAGVGSMITGLQTMPSVAWYPLAIVLFALDPKAILFVVVLGAAPSIANGIIDGIDSVPPVLVRAGRVLGAHGFSNLRHVVIPAALPSVVSGLKQGWAFAWRSLLAGELIANFTPIGLGQQLRNASDVADYPSLYQTMIVLFVVGVVIDALFFGTAVRFIRRRYGLIDAAE